jgi:glucuronate isomerase
MENGLLPNDEKWIAELLTKICYQNAKDYFNLK